MERLNAYSQPDGRGGTVVDVEGMAVDLITVLKATGTTKENAIMRFASIWDDVHVDVSIPAAAKN